MNYLLTIEYEGTRYEGWQRQKKTTQTIQGKLEQVLSRMTEKEIEIPDQRIYAGGKWQLDRGQCNSP